MRAKQFSTAVLILISSISSYAKFEAHEWGTFTSLLGSNGITQNGMYHEDEPLPGFVHGFGEVAVPPLPPPPPDTDPFPPDRPCHFKGCFKPNVLSKNIITQKMETPVIYFYTDVKRKVEVNVNFPEGVITETYPAPIRTSPTKENVSVLANGHSTFNVDVLPTLNSREAIPYVDPSNIYAHARAVASNVVMSGNELEKFIFYRGLGRFQPKISITSHSGILDIYGDTKAMPSAAFLIHVNSSGHGQMLNLGKLNIPMSGATTTRKEIAALTIADLSFHTGYDRPESGIVSGQDAKDQLVQGLTSAGLHADEALAMVNTWENGYLKVPGLRLLYILPREEVDRVLPVSLNPAPEHFERVFVGRMEILLDTAERQILDDVLAKKEAFDVNSLGRFAEPILRRVSQTYFARVGHERQSLDPEIITVFDKLIERASLSDTTARSSIQ